MQMSVNEFLKLGWKLGGCGANVNTFWGCQRCQCDQTPLETAKSAGMEKVFPNLYKLLSIKYFINWVMIKKACTWRNHKNCQFFRCCESCCGNVRIKDISQHQIDPECLLKLLNWTLQLLQDHHWADACSLWSLKVPMFMTRAAEPLMQHLQYLLVFPFP